MRPNAVLVLDVGKTNVKLVAVEEGRASFELSTHNRSVEGPPYLHFDTESLWPWIVDGLREVAGRFTVEAIIPCTHGSGLAVLAGDTLALPIMDYSAEPPPEIAAAYRARAPAFAECGCEVGPLALTSALQLHWQSRAFPESFARATRILCLAQYWAWRLSGVAAGEVTQLGAQTQLWNPAARRFSTLAEREGWAALFPPLRPAWDRLGPIRPELAAASGLPPSCPVLCGIHDSSASYLAYLKGGLERATVLSTGTWIIGFNPLQPIERLSPERDTVSNSTVLGAPLASSRYMGGEEYAHLMGGLAPATATMEAARAILASGVMAFPSFVNWGGPYIGCRGHIVGEAPADATGRAALAALYAALVSNTCLDLLDSREDLVIEGHFAENEVYRRTLAALRPSQRVLTVTSPGGSAIGASLLHDWERSRSPVSLAPVSAEPIPGLDGYAMLWHAQAERAFAERGGARAS